MKYIPTIGLEIHAELKTQSKMFCSCPNDTEEKEPNSLVCPICLGNPGTLPFPNKEAVRSVLKVGVAVGGKLADFSEFDRKNYFYPDIPKNYQISQYKYPLVEGGEILGIKIKRIHLEEDTAKSTHDKGDYSLVDFNRAGVPLMELVTEPVIHDGKTASAFAKELQLILRALKVSDANMEKGEMRVEANISVSDSDELGTKVEVKNLNSFKVVEKSINYEIERQTQIKEAGESVVHETRGWDESKQKTFSQRRKEESHDYRYFPDPDIPKLNLSKTDFGDENTLKKSLPILPKEKREKYIELGLKREDADMFTSDEIFGGLFDETRSFFDSASVKEKTKLLANYISSDIAGLVKGRETFSVNAKNLARLIDMVSSGEINSRGAKDLIAIMVDKDINPVEEAKRLGLVQTNNKDALKKVIEKVIKNNPKPVLEYKAGKTAVIGFLLGACMKESGGAGNPQALRELLLVYLK